MPILPRSHRHRSTHAAHTARMERPSAVAAWLLCLPWLLALVCLMTLQHGARAAAHSAPAHAGAALGAGPASLTVLDPVDQLAIDLAEHLPAADTARPLPPLPLHEPWADSSPVAADEAQGAELPALLAPPRSLAGAQTLPAPWAAARFDSSDLRRTKRPPRSPDDQRP